MFILRVGLPRSTKSYSMIKDMYRIAKRNKRWYEKGKMQNRRMIVTNIKVSDRFKEVFGDYIIFFKSEIDFRRLVLQAQDSDIFIDEISNYWDADNYMNMPMNYKVFLNEYAKNGNTITANTQDASQLYSRARRKVTKVYMHKKLFGSPSPSPTRPKIKFVWGVFITIPHKFKMSPDGELELTTANLIPIPNFGTIESFYTDMYDTRQKIGSMDKQTVTHRENYCEHYGDPYYSPEEMIKRGEKPIPCYDKPVKVFHK